MDLPIYIDLERARPGLVPKKITDKRGHHTTVWVSPEGSAKDEKDSKGGIPKGLLEKLERRGSGNGREVPLTKQELKIVLDSGRFALVSAGKNPNDPKDKNLSDKAIRYRHQVLRRRLIKDGFAFTQVEGNYGEREDSFLVMVHGPERKYVRDLGREFRQDSVIYVDRGRTEMHFTTGENAKKGLCYAGKGWKETPKARAYYTSLKHPNGSSTKFTLNFDFSRPGPCGRAAKAEIVYFTLVKGKRRLARDLNSRERERLDHYLKRGVTRVQWAVGAPSTSCRVCRGLHGKLFGISSLLKSGFPLTDHSHPNCRCRFKAHPEKFNLSWRRR